MTSMLGKNPNFHFWISKKDRSTNLQDIPNIEDYEQKLVDLSEKALQKKNMEALKRLNKSDKYLVSVDDPKKYEIVKTFIRNKKLKVYGGVAINSYLPESQKFYKKGDVPDYDVFSPDPWNDAVQLADIFYQKGYKYVEVKAGIHHGTYKVFVNLWNVADITYMIKEDYDKIETSFIDGVYVVSPLKLLESMYKEYSEPMTNPARLPKVGVREKLLWKATNPLDNELCDYREETLTELQKSLLTVVASFFKHKNVVYGGSEAYNTYVKLGNGTVFLKNPEYVFFSENASKDVEQLFTLLLPFYRNMTIVTTYSPTKEINNYEYSIVMKEGFVLCRIYQITVCIPFKFIGNKKIVSIDYLKYELMNSIVFYINKEEIRLLKCKLKYIIELQYKYYKKHKITELDNSPFQRFISDCQGDFVNNIKVSILERIKEMKEEKKLVKKIYKKDRVIKYYPRSKVSLDCKGKSKEMCIFPCGWNKHNKKCYNIPKGVYRPDDGEENFKE